MKAFEFVLIIISLIIGLALTEAAIGVSYMIQNYKIANLYPPYIAATITGFLLLLNYYSSIFRLRKVTQWNVPNIGLVFITGLLYFILTQIFIPDQTGFDQDYERYFNENIVVVLILLVCFLLSYMLETYFVRKVRKRKAYLMLIFYISVLLTGIFISNEVYRGILAFVLLAFQLYNVYLAKLRIEDSET